MKALKKFIILLLVLVIIILVAALFLPSKKHIEDSVSINAPAKVIYEQVVYFENWAKWSPFQENDSNMVTTYENPDSIVGQVMIWKSEKDGNGKMTIIEVEEFKKIRTRLEFENQGAAFSDWFFTEENGVTKVTWTLDMGDLGYPVGRIMGIFMPGMIHKSYQKGLASLKKVCEDYLAALSFHKMSEITLKDYPAKKAVFVRDSATCDKVSDVLGKSYGIVMSLIMPDSIECDGPPFARWIIWNDTINKFVVEAGMFVKTKPNVKDNILYAEYPAQKVVSAIHTGPYETLYKSHEAIDAWIKENKLAKNGVAWEIYIIDPQKEPDMTKWETEIIYPVK